MTTKNQAEFSFTGPRVRFFQQLWRELCALEELPQVDRWLSVRLKQDRRFGQQDRRWYSEAVFSALRQGIFAAACEEAHARADQELPWDAWQQRAGSDWWQHLRALDGARLVRWLLCRADAAQLAPSEGKIVQQITANADLGARLLTAGLAPSLGPMLAERASCSNWSADDLALWIKQQNERAPLWLRLNHEKYHDACEKELMAAGFNLAWDGPVAVCATGTKGIYAMPSFTKGWIEIQDRASQRIGESPQLASGSFIWDCCAGGGGKSLQLASRLKGSGAVYVSDVRAYKLDEIKKRAKRAEFSNIRYLAWDGSTVPAVPKVVGQRGGFDVIVVDAPCSSSGTWRRNPDARFRLQESHLDELSQIQEGILPHIFSLLKPGGQLVYATCSWLARENEVVLARWLAAEPSLKLEKAGIVGTPYEDADTMFVACLRKDG